VEKISDKLPSTTKGRKWKNIGTYYANALLRLTGSMLKEIYPFIN
jgi:hypothetical protein